MLDRKKGQEILLSLSAKLERMKTSLKINKNKSKIIQLLNRWRIHRIIIIVYGECTCEYCNLNSYNIYTQTVTPRMTGEKYTVCIFIIILTNEMPLIVLLLLLEQYID